MKCIYYKYIQKLDDEKQIIYLFRRLRGKLQMLTHSNRWVTPVHTPFMTKISEDEFKRLKELR